MDILILLTVLQMVPLTGAYEFICPSQSHWNLRAKSMCKQTTNYTCLFDINFQINVYRDRCYRPRILGPGYKYVFQPNLNRASCSGNRYQPFNFETVGYSDCTFQKSFCISQGQETYENGDTRSDRKCVCNTDRGYTFVRNSNSQCFCNPTTEDCSCYLGINPYNETIGLEDIKCNDDMTMTKRLYTGDMFNISRVFRIIEFDNFKYNLNYVHSNENRIEAAISVLTLLLVYFAVCIIVHRIIPRWIQIHNTPRRFAIVECFDCSITIEWYIHDQDDSLKYDLDYRNKETDTWTVATLSTRDVLAKENGRRVYTLLNILPETEYELKLCSVDNHVKSHYTESKTILTPKRAPRRLAIVECFDCSITIEWYMHDQDDSFQYDLDYRNKKTDKWTVATLSTRDVLEEENGRRVYTLLNILPETGYELKLCSVNNHVKSHYTESKTILTPKRVFPEAINQLTQEDKTRYEKLSQSEKTEKRYFVRTMIVGKESVGKTCLLRRLLKEDISNVTSTDGVDIVVRRCKINIEDGSWTIDKEISDDNVGRIKRALISTADNRDSQHMKVDEKKNINIKNRDEKIDSTTEAKVSMGKSEDTNESALVIHGDVDTEANINFNKNNDTTECSTLVIHEDLATDTKVGSDKNKDTNETASLVMPVDLLSSVFSKSNENTLSNLYALCELWDFAGQKEFYATHQAFLTSCAVYLVVANMEDDMSKQGLSQCFADFQHIGEYVDFWFDSIHCHRTTDQPARYGHFNPPILLVFTGKDKYDKAGFKKREKEINDQMDQVFGLQSKYHHLHKTFYLSNTTDTDEEFEKLRYGIFESARNKDDWGKACPLKWILLEHLIHINKKSGKNFITFTDMFKLAKHPNINISEKKDLLLFLRFQHNVGNIIFFENIPDLIILNPQWLADACRCLVSDRVENRRLYHLEDWTLFKRQGKISESLISELFESKDGSQFSGQKNNLHKVMEKLDIIVRIENSSYYIMPSMMPSSTFGDVCEKIGILNGKCKRTSWLCFKFEFLPPSFFNHISAWFIRNYFSITVDGGIALYRGICMFDIDKSGGTKIMVSMSTDTIALQVLSFSKEQEGIGSMCSNIYREVKQLIGDIKKRYKVKYISFKLHFKCSDGYYFKDTFEYKNLINEKECFCIQHKQMHQSEQLYSPWMENEVKEIPDRTKINTTQDDQNPENEPNKEEAQDQTPVKTNLPVSVNLRQQFNIKQSTNGNLYIYSCIKIDNTLVFSDLYNKRLIICNSDGTNKHHMSLSYTPRYITEIDSNTVAVSCGWDKTILIIDISTRSVTSTINISDDCWGISYNDNNLYVVIGSSTIHVMDLTGKIIRTIPSPSDYIHDITVDRDRLVCIDNRSIYCCSLEGKVMWKFKKDEFQDFGRVTTDNEGNVYVSNRSTTTVIVVSDDGKHHRELLTKSDGLDKPWGIYFDKKENNLLVCHGCDAFLFDVKQQ